MSDLAGVCGLTIVQKLGSGGYGEIFSVKTISDNVPLALKTETIDSPNSSLATEIEMLGKLPDDPCFPHVIKQGETPAVRFFLMPLYGPSLSAIRHQIQGERFSMATVCKVALETMKILEKLHQTGVVHCDVKPSNFLLNQKMIGGLVLIDFGLSSQWRQCSNHEHIEPKESSFRGTLKYASVNVHKGYDPTRRDDVISWFYSMVELAKGKLPWKDVLDNSLALSCKQRIEADKLCAGLPEAFVGIWNSVKDLEFSDEPDYRMIKRELGNILTARDWSKVPYDWESDSQIIHQLTPFPGLFDLQVPNQPVRKRRRRMCCVE
jgi:serine/threonine protein kinase